MRMVKNGYDVKMNQMNGVMNQGLQMVMNMRFGMWIRSWLKRKDYVLYKVEHGLKDGQLTWFKGV